MKIAGGTAMFFKEDSRCLHCHSSNTEYKGAEPHGSMVDHLFECSCGSSWAFITEGDRVHRYQFTYPREKA